jgi:hypothetical protein
MLHYMFIQSNIRQKEADKFWYERKLRSSMGFTILVVAR